MTRFLITTMLAAGLGLPAQAQDRAVSGALTYLPRIALPDEATVTVSLQGAFGTVLGETRFDTEGAQVPLSFSLDAMPGLNGTLGALIRVDGATWWLAQDVPVPAGQDPVDLGQVRLEPFTPLAFANAFDCGGMAVSFGIAGEQAVLRVGDRDYEMRQVVSASGARYVAVADDGTEFWSKGDEAMLTVEGQDMGTCTRAVPEPADYRARGNEPGWSATIGESVIDLDADYGALTRSTPRPEVQVQPGAYVFDMPAIEARLTLEDRLCADDATGMPYPHHATLLLEGRELAGCGGDPASLLTGADWLITDIDGDAVAGEADATLAFTADGRAYGSTGCNRFFGGYSLTGEGLSLGRMGVTMMACPAPLMAQERAVLDALSAVTRFEIGAEGALHLMGGAQDAALLTLRRD